MLQKRNIIVAKSYKIERPYGILRRALVTEIDLNSPILMGHLEPERVLLHLTVFITNLTRDYFSIN